MNLLAAALVVFAAAGCEAPSDVPVGDAAENLRKLALAYVQYAASHRGLGPADRETLIEFLSNREGITADEAADRFVSPRDQQPYVIRWGLRPTGSGPLGPDPPKAPLIIYEQSGVDRMHYVADGKLSIKQMPRDELAKAAPDAKLPPI